MSAWEGTICANERCLKIIEDPHPIRIYCSDSCGSAQRQREYRRRKAAETVCPTCGQEVPAHKRWMLRNDVE